MGAEGVDAAQVKMGFSRVTGCCSLGNKSFLLSALAFTFVILNLAALWALHFADRPVTKGSLRSATRFSTGQLGATNGATPSVGDVVSFNNDNVLRVGAGTTAYLNLMTLNADAFNIPYVNFAPMGTGSNYTNVMGYTVRQDSATTSFLTTMTFNPDNRTIVAGSISDANTFTSDAIRGLATLSDTQMAVLTVWNTSDGYTSVKTAVTPATLDASTGSVTLDKSKIANVTTGSATNFIAPIFELKLRRHVLRRMECLLRPVREGLSTEFGAPVALKGLSSTGAGFAIPYYTELDSYTQDPNNPKTDSDLSGICVTTAVFSDNALSSFTTPVCGTGYRPGHYPEIVALSDSAIAVIFYDTANNNALTVVTMTLSSDKILSISGSYVFPEVHGDLSAYSPSFLSPHGRLLSGNRLAVSFLNPAMNGRLCVRVFSFSLYTLTLKELTPVLPVGPSDFAWVTTSNKWPVNHAMVPLGADGFVTGYVGRRNNVLQQTFAAFESFGNPVGIVQSTSGDSVSVTTQGNAKTSGLTDGAVYYATTSGAVVAQNGTSMDPDFFYTADGTMLVTQDSRRPLHLPGRVVSPGTARSKAKCRCMGTEDSNNSQTAIDIPLPSFTAATVSQFDVTALRRDFERLSVDDLTALASFPVEPHELIGRVVAVTHCLLLTLAPEHTALELRAPPWPLLRLQLLENTHKIWRKLRKRAWQLETGVKSLSPIQIRFGYKELVPFILPQKLQNRRHHGWEIDRLAQVSTIAASLGAWVVFCLYCSAEPPLTTCLRCEIAASATGQNGIVVDQPVPRVKIPARNKSPRKRGLNQNANGSSNIVRAVPTSKLEPLVAPNRCLRSSRRCGIKIGGRFLLFHARFPSGSSDKLAVKYLETLGEWSVYCLDINRVGMEQHKDPVLKQVSVASELSPLSKSWWKPPRTIENLARTFALCYMTPLAQQSLLLQLGFRDHLFERSQDIPYVKTPLLSSPAFTLKFDAVTVHSQQQCFLLGIGNVLVMMETTIADLRSQLAPLVVSHLLNLADKQCTFGFMYRGSVLAQSQEKHLAAVNLLPFALLVVAGSIQRKPLRVGHCTSQLWCHHTEVSQSLVNYGVPDHISQPCSVPVLGSTNTAVQIFAMHQPYIPRIVSTTAISTTSIVVEFFTHWRAFVYFQQLQDSSVLFQIQQHHAKKQTKPPKCRQNNAQEDAKDEKVLYGPQPQPLPQKKFKSKKEWLLPIYATIDIVSPSAGLLKTPFRQYVEHTLSSPCRFVLAEEPNVIHFTQVNGFAAELDSFGVHLSVFDVTFVRDESCSLDSLLKLKGAYVWLIVPRNPHNDRGGPALPTEWMIDLYRFVQHPTYDFQTPESERVTNFRVRMSWRRAERAVEAAFWSKDVDWRSSMSSTDLYNTVLRQIFDALCRSHPPAFGVDSVKFSKLLYEAKIQPNLLAIGDAAFLFASNVTPGFSYEMGFDGFVRAVKWLAQQFYSKKNVKVSKSPSKMLPGMQHSMMKWQLSRRGEMDAGDYLLSSLRRFCYETLVHLPSVASTWRDIMDSWRLARKQQCLQEYTLKYCAATRLRASWVGFVTWRIFLHRRQRMREERLAATKLQSVARGHSYGFKLDQSCADFERSVQHLLKECDSHDRIREKRLRRLGVAVFPLETRRVRFSLYRAKPKALENAPASNEAKQDGLCDAYELEVVDPTRSWGQLFNVSQQQLDQFVIEETKRLVLQQESGLAILGVPAKKEAPSTTPSPLVQTKLPRGRKEVNTSLVRDSVAHPVLKPNIMLLALARRLAIVRSVAQGDVNLRCYSDSIETSLGKLVFKGALRSQLDLEQDDRILGKSLVQRHIVRILEWADTLKFMVYTPATSARRRYDLASSFVLSVLQFSRFGSMRLSIPEGDGIVAADEVENSALRDSRYSIPHQIHHIVNGPHKLVALRYILSYVLQYGVRTPTYSMMPHVIAERERQRRERESADLDAILARERQLFVKVQARVRQHLARIIRLQLALSSYSKEFDPGSGRFVYVLQHQSGDRTVLGERKPFSLFDQDVPSPADEWLAISAPATSNSDKMRFFNPRRGVYSRYNDALAAMILQRWFRGKMWDGINNWKLREIALALSYHSNAQKPTKMSDPRQLENIKRQALQLHVLQHEVQQARALVGNEIVSTVHEIEQNSFRWALFLQPKNPHVRFQPNIPRTSMNLMKNANRFRTFKTIANYAVYLQCVHLDIDKAELLYRRALDLDPVNDLFVTNFQRLQSERAPGRKYAFAGPGTIALARSSEVHRCGPNFQWREMEDPAALPPMPTRFFHNLRTGKCTWEIPTEGQGLETTPDQDSTAPITTSTSG
ncbi:hypothetical protein ON010_g3929 [Phytophthora cinnamomi]|nr:hypothetical protein ON010_g3929 [Phytophthora cinnamomi]